MSVQSDIIISQDVLDAWGRVNRERTSRWFTAGYPSDSTATLELRSEGFGGLQEFIDNLPENEIIWGAFTIFGVDDKGPSESKRSIAVFVKYFPPSVSVMKKARAGGHKGAVKAALREAYIDIEIEQKGELTIKLMNDKVKAAGSTNLARYEFDCEASAPPIIHSPSPSKAPDGASSKLKSKLKDPNFTQSLTEKDGSERLESIIAATLNPSASKSSENVNELTDVSSPVSKPAGSSSASNITPQSTQFSAKTPRPVSMTAQPVTSTLPIPPIIVENSTFTDDVSSPTAISTTVAISTANAPNLDSAEKVVQTAVEHESKGSVKKINENKLISTKSDGYAASEKAGRSKDNSEYAISVLGNVFLIYVFVNITMFSTTASLTTEGSSKKFMKEYFSYCVILVELFGGLVLIAGALVALINTAISSINSHFETKIGMVCPLNHSSKHMKKVKVSIASFTKVRQQLGALTSMGLEMLVVSQVLATVAKDTDEHDIQQLYKMGILLLVRTGLGFMLGLEVKEIDEKLEKEEEEEEEVEEEGEITTESDREEGVVVPESVPATSRTDVSQKVHPESLLHPKTSRQAQEQMFFLGLVYVVIVSALIYFFKAEDFEIETLEEEIVETVIHAVEEIKHSSPKCFLGMCKKG